MRRKGVMNLKLHLRCCLGWLCTCLGHRIKVDGSGLQILQASGGQSCLVCQWVNRRLEGRCRVRVLKFSPRLRRRCGPHERLVSARGGEQGSRREWRTKRGWSCVMEGSVPQRQKRYRSCSTLGATQFAWQMQLNAVINAHLSRPLIAFEPATAKQIQTRRGGAAIPATARCRRRRRRRRRRFGSSSINQVS
jgi:hypothetical protein